MPTIMDITAEIPTLIDHLVYKWLADPRPDPNNPAIPPDPLVPGDLGTPQGTLPPIFPGLLFSPEDLMAMRSAVVDGWPMPTTAIWRKGTVTIPDDRYGKSVLKRPFVSADGDFSSIRVIDWTAPFGLFAKAYDVPFVNAVNQKVQALDIDRYFDFDLSDLYGEPFITRAEFKLKGSDRPDNLLEDSDFRKFYISSDWELTITIPVIESAWYIERIHVFINDNPIVTVEGA